jgi:hypothetical protein
MSLKDGSCVCIILSRAIVSCRNPRRANLCFVNDARRLRSRFVESKWCMQVIFTVISQYVMHTQTFLVTAWERNYCCLTAVLNNWRLIGKIRLPVLRTARTASGSFRLSTMWRLSRGKKRRPRFWMHEIYAKRNADGEFYLLFNDFMRNDDQGEKKP